MMVYLASPYTHAGPAVRHERYRAACIAAAKLMEQGNVVFCPVAHSHPIALWLGEGVACDAAFWKRQDAPYLHFASELVVLKLDGWDRSSGVAHEIDVARERGVPVRYIAP